MLTPQRRLDSNLARYIVFVEPCEQSVQFGDTLLCVFQLLLGLGKFRGLLLNGVVHSCHDKPVLILLDKISFTGTSSCLLYQAFSQHILHNRKGACLLDVQQILDISIRCKPVPSDEV